MYIYYMKSDKRIVITLTKKAVSFSDNLEEREVNGNELIKEVKTTLHNGDTSIEKYYIGL